MRRGGCGMQPDCDLLPIKGTFVSQSKHLPFFILLMNTKITSLQLDLLCGSQCWNTLALQHMVFLLTRKKKKKKLSVNKVFLLQCVLCLPPTWHLTSEREAEYWPASFYTSWTRCFRFISAKIKRRQKSCFRSRGKKIKINHMFNWICEQRSRE